MKHTYQIHGMTCNGCRSHVAETLSKVKGVTNATVNLEKAEATIEMEKHIPLETFQEALKNDGGRYSIHKQGEHQHIGEAKKEVKPNAKGTGTYYCPMHCEGDKTYDKAGDCPVCGMDLVEQQNLSSTSSEQWTCPMHPEIVKDEAGDCPICGMDLVPLQPDISSEEKTYKKLLKKFWIASVFTLPIFLIAMSEMITNNPLYELLEQKYWNWIQLVLSIPVVFYATWMFFERAYKSIKTWNLNMFTLIGIGAGAAWLFSVFGMLFPDIFPAQFKTEAGAVHVYFEAATVILTLVLLGQLLEARAHSKTNSAVKELLKLAPNKAIKIVNGEEVEVTIDKAEIKSVMHDEAKKYQQQGKTVSFLSVDNAIVGYVVIGDKIKATSAKAIAELQKNGIDVIMLTGDNHDTAKAVADELNLADFKAGMLPEDKMKVVEKLQQQGKVVAMAGDGINDAPALAKSDVGIAMGTGTDVAIESAMITLIKGDLHGIVKAQKLSHSVMRNIKQNLFFALVYNTLGIPIAAGLLFPFFGLLLSPMIAALAMSFSSVSVIANALRLRTIKI